MVLQKRIKKVRKNKESTEEQKRYRRIVKRGYLSDRHPLFTLSPVNIAHAMNPDILRLINLHDSLNKWKGWKIF